MVAKSLASAETFAVRVPDLIMVDHTQAALFGIVRNVKNSFGRLGSWPYLDALLRDYSRTVLATQGSEVWQAHGGIYESDGTPGCSTNSLMAAKVVRHAATTHGGVRWIDESGVTWAVRLLAVPNRTDEFFGFAIGCPAAYSVAAHRTGMGEFTAQTAERVNPRFPAASLHLGPRASCLLWAIHAAVLLQRRSVVLVPDVMLGQVLFGARSDDAGTGTRWPSNWRGDVLNVLYSLTHVRCSVLRLGKEGWNPRFASQSVALASVEDLFLAGQGEDFCAEDCPSWRMAGRHHHIRVQIGLGFLGVLEHFVTGNDEGGRTYDFRKVPEASREIIRQAQKRGKIVTVSAPLAMMGAASWANLSPAANNIYHAISRELTRTRDRVSARPDRARILVGNHVPGRSPKMLIVCPHLTPGGRYVVFGGNGVRAGMGYRLVGETGGGWLGKCGYRVADDRSELLRSVREFFAGLPDVRNMLALTVVGFDPKDLIWYGWEDLQALARRRSTFDQLDTLHIRIYAPEDYLERSRRFLAVAGGFAHIPGGSDVGSIDGEFPRDENSGMTEGLVDLRHFGLLLTQHGITQSQAAAALGVTQPFINQLVTAKRPWPAELGDRARAFISRHAERH